MQKANVRAKITEVDTLASALVRTFATSELAGDLVLAPYFAELAEVSTKLNFSIRQEKELSGLDACDTERDRIVSDLFTLVRGYSVIPIESKRAAAQRLLSVCNKYKGIASESYLQESSLINSLLGDLSLDKSRQDVALLEGVTELVESLAAAEKAFEARSDEWNKIAGAKKVAPSSLKKDALAIINEKIVVYLNAMERAQPQIFGKFCESISSAIARANATCAKSSKAATPNIATEL